MANYIDNMNTSIRYAEQIEAQYPDIYSILYPYIHQITYGLDERTLQNLTVQDIDRITREVASASGIYAKNPQNHSRGLLDLIIKILILRALLDRDRNRTLRPFHLFPPAFFFPGMNVPGNNNRPGGGMPQNPVRPNRPNRPNRPRRPGGMYRPR